MEGADSFCYKRLDALGAQVRRTRFSSYIRILSFGRRSSPGRSASERECITRVRLVLSLTRFRGHLTAPKFGGRGVTTSPHERWAGGDRYFLRRVGQQDLASFGDSALNETLVTCQQRSTANCRATIPSSAQRNRKAVAYHAGIRSHLQGARCRLVRWVRLRQEACTGHHCTERLRVDLVEARLVHLPRLPCCCHASSLASAVCARDRIGLRSAPSSRIPLLRADAHSAPHRPMRSTAPVPCRSSAAMLR
jgi:hypothetical protein